MWHQSNVNKSHMKSIQTWFQDMNDYNPNFSNIWNKVSNELMFVSWQKQMLRPYIHKVLMPNQDKTTTNNSIWNKSYLPEFPLQPDLQKH